jgi:hypothetical protein
MSNSDHARQARKRSAPYPVLESSKVAKLPGEAAYRRKALDRPTEENSPELIHFQMKRSGVSVRVKSSRRSQILMS